MSDNDSLIKHYEKDGETGEIIPVRFMNESEIKYRDELRYANTASALRARVLEELSKANGHSNGATSVRI